MSIKASPARKGDTGQVEWIDPYTPYVGDLIPQPYVAECSRLLVDEWIALRSGWERELRGTA